MNRNPSIAIIGAGMSGICLAITFLRNGFTDIVIYEKSSEVGGTWRENIYPGLNCDVPSRLYQYSFATNPDWTHVFASGSEIQSYFTELADRFALRDRIRFCTEIVSARFDGDRWVIRTDAGVESSVDFLISATGVLHHPRMPAIPGLEEFSGALFHSARWDRRVKVKDQRIAIVGTGSTGVQLVCSLAGTARNTILFQRTAQWVLEVPNRRYSKVTRRIYQAFPPLNWLIHNAYRVVFELMVMSLIKPGLHRRMGAAVCRANLRKVHDADLRRSLTPDYEPMCKRLVLSRGFYRAMQRDDVELVTAGIDYIERRGIVTSDGVLHEADIIVLATGFDSHAFFRPMQLVGRDGINIQDVWRDGPHGYQTVSIPGFPNFFMMMGPHSPVGNFPLTAVAEAQAKHILRWVSRWSRYAFDTVEPTGAATDEFNAKVRAAMPNTVWTTGCNSWYLNKAGVPEVWPFTPAAHRSMLANSDRRQYHLRRYGSSQVAVDAMAAGPSATRTPSVALECHTTTDR